MHLLKQVFPHFTSPHLTLPFCYLFLVNPQAWQKSNEYRNSILTKNLPRPAPRSFQLDAENQQLKLPLSRLSRLIN
jgi:hypothetical protein